MSKSIFVILYVSIVILSSSVLAGDAVSTADKASDAPALKIPPKKPRLPLPYDDPGSFLFERQSDGTIKVIGRNDVTVTQIGKDEYEITYQNTGVKNVVNVSDTSQSN